MGVTDHLAIETTLRSPVAYAAAPRMATGRELILRIGAWSAIVGGLLALVVNVLHPHPTDYQLETLLDQISKTGAWGALHLTLIVAVMFVLVALVALTISLEREPGSTFGRIACVMAVIGGALLLTSTALDGFAMSRLADDWVNASVAEKATALRNASVLEETQYAIYSLSTVLFLGIGIALYGLATLLDGGFPRWLGWLAIVSGGGELVIGIVQALTGPSYRGVELPDTVFSMLITLWMLSMGAVMWRKSRVRQAAAGRPAAR